MGTVLAKINTEVTLQFTAFDIDGVTLLTGKVDGDWGKKLLRGVTTISLVTVTVTEVVGSPGRYAAVFTPDAVGLWYVEITSEVDDVFACYVDASEVGGASDGEILIDRIEDIWRILGLDPNAPLCVSKTRQEAGDILLQQTEVGVKVIVQRQE